MKLAKLYFLMLVGCLIGGLQGLQAQAGQSCVVDFVPRYHGQALQLGQSYALETGDSFAIETLRFYISELQFFKGSDLVFTHPQKHVLIDAEILPSCQLSVDLPAGLDFDRILFQLGIDSLTNAAGARGGDLDPTKGMYWAWQSGYINFKMEGKSAICPARNHVFQYHLGGFLPPFYALQQVQIAVPKHGKRIAIGLELDQILGQVDLRQTYEVMRPCEPAVRLSQLVQSAFIWIP